MKLYFSPITCALSPYIVILEAELPHELVQVDLKTHTLPDGSDYYKINSFGYVPLLETDDGRFLNEGVAIIQYLADQSPTKQLAPENGTFERYVLQSRLNFIATDLVKNYDLLFLYKDNQEVRQAAIKSLHKHYAWIDSILENQAFFLNDHFTVADAYLFTVTEWSKLVQLDLSSFKYVQKYLQAIRQRPAVQQALMIENAKKSSSGCHNS